MKRPVQARLPVAYLLAISGLVDCVQPRPGQRSGAWAIRKYPRIAGDNMCRIEPIQLVKPDRITIGTLTNHSGQGKVLCVGRKR